MIALISSERERERESVCVCVCVRALMCEGIKQKKIALSAVTFGLDLNYLYFLGCREFFYVVFQV
jgi:hypothetical protein